MLSLHGKVYIVTGANQGIGYEITKYLASRGGQVFMVCRNKARAEAARQAILAETRSSSVECLICDCGVEADVRSMWAEFGRRVGKLDGLVCNAGALFNEKTLTQQGLEATFASHLLYGSYLMTQLALPHLQQSDDPRVVLVSSGGMYNTPFPKWEVASGQSGKYDGQLAYAYAKRGQVLLCERWAAEDESINFVSVHPGWTGTAAVDNAYGDKKSYLEPLRSTWEGAEGIAWLAAIGGNELESGAFYLDRTPQVKHMAGAFFSEGSYTKNTDVEVDRMVANLDAWANGRWSEVPAPEALAKARAVSRLAPMEGQIDIKRFMGRWYVAASIPTYFEKGATNCVEDYIWDEGEGRVQVRFSYTKPGGGEGAILQRATMVNPPSNTEWAIAPKLGVYLPLGLGYILCHCADDYSFCIVGLPDRSNVWIMGRVRCLPPAVYADGLRRVEALGFDMSKVVRIFHDGEPEPES